MVYKAFARVSVMSGEREMCHLARYKSGEKNSGFTKVLVTSFPLLMWLRCLAFIFSCRLSGQWASGSHSKEFFSLIDTIQVTHYKPWQVIIIINIIKVLTTNVFCQPVIVGSVYVMSTVVPQFLVPDGFYFCFLCTWKTRYFLLSKMLFNANISVLRGVARCGFGEKCCLHLQGLQRLYIIQDAFVPYVIFPCKCITHTMLCTLWKMFTIYCLY